MDCPLRHCAQCHDFGGKHCACHGEGAALPELSVKLSARLDPAYEADLSRLVADLDERVRNPKSVLA